MRTNHLTFLHAHRPCSKWALFSRTQGWAFLTQQCCWNDIALTKSSDKPVYRRLQASWLKVLNAHTALTRAWPGGGVWRPPPSRIFAIAQKRTALSTWNLAGLLIQQFHIVSGIFFWNPSEIFWDMVDFVTSLHATFGRKLAKLRGSLEDAVFNKNANEKHQKT